MPNDDLGRLLDALDAETRAKWEKWLSEIDGEIESHGPAVARQHLEEALKHSSDPNELLRAVGEPVPHE